jgi:hypothetical protein
MLEGRLRSYSPECLLSYIDPALVFTRSIWAPILSTSPAILGPEVWVLVRLSWWERLSFPDEAEDDRARRFCILPDCRKVLCGIRELVRMEGTRVLDRRRKLSSLASRYLDLDNVVELAGDCSGHWCFG